MLRRPTLGQPELHRKTMSLFFYFCRIYFMFECFACTMCVPGAGGGQKRVLDPLELELQVVGSHHVGVGK